MLADSFILSFILRYALASLSGLRYSIPLLGLSLLVRFHWLTLPSELNIISSDAMLIALGVELLFEISPIALKHLRGLAALANMLLCIASATLIELSAFPHPWEPIAFLCSLLFAGGSAALLQYARTHVDVLAWTQSWKGSVLSLGACAFALLFPMLGALVMIAVIGTMLVFVLSGKAMQHDDEIGGDDSYPVP